MSSSIGPVAGGNFGPPAWVTAAPLASAGGRAGPVDGFRLTVGGRPGGGITAGGGAVSVGIGSGAGLTGDAGSAGGRATGITSGAGPGSGIAAEAGITGLGLTGADMVTGAAGTDMGAGIGAGVAVGAGSGTTESTSVITYCGPFGPWISIRIGVPVPRIGVAGIGIVVVTGVPGMAACCIVGDIPVAWTVIA